MILIVVPGRIDRAFYKSLCMYIARKLGFQLIDLDAERYEKEKLCVLNKVYSFAHGVYSGKAIVRGSAALRVSSNNKDTAIVILPAGESARFIHEGESAATYIASTILGYQAGLDKPTIDFVIVAEDAENMDFDKRLESLYNSLMAYGDIEIEKKLESGKYFQLFNLKRPKDVKLMLLVQGLEQQSLVSKHAIEDFILYLYIDDVNELRKLCPKIINSITTNRQAHKKMALLIAICRCYKGIEEMIFRDLARGEKFERLFEVHDGLRKIIDIMVTELK